MMHIQVMPIFCSFSNTTFEQSISYNNNPVNFFLMDRFWFLLAKQLSSKHVRKFGIGWC